MGEGEGDGEGVVVLEKKAVIWRCGFTIGDLPLLCLRDGAIFSILIFFFSGFERERLDTGGEGLGR